MHGFARGLTRPSRICEGTAPLEQDFIAKTVSFLIKRFVSKRGVGRNFPPRLR